MAASPIPTTAPRRPYRTGVEKALAERDALAAELAVRDTSVAVHEARQAWMTAGSEADRQAAAAQYRQLLSAFRGAERTADHAWRRLCRILADR